MLLQIGQRLIIAIAVTYWRAFAFFGLDMASFLAPGLQVCGFDCAFGAFRSFGVRQRDTDF